MAFTQDKNVFNDPKLLISIEGTDYILPLRELEDVVKVIRVLQKVDSSGAKSVVSFTVKPLPQEYEDA